MVSKFDIEIIRGDDFALDVYLAQGFEDVVAAPANYNARLALRLDQLDTLPIILSLDAPAELEPATDTCPARVYFHFSATTAQTGALPPYDLVHFVELLEPSVSSAKRLFQGKACISD
jgi:hypothetical protein